MLVLGLLLYLAADFANPLMPGAVCFDPDESIDGLARARWSAIVPPVLTGAAAAPVTPARAVAVSRSVPSPARRAVHPIPRARAALALVSDRSSDDA